MAENVVKVMFINNNGELVTRRIPVKNDVKFNDFHEKVRTYFGVSSDTVTEIHYKDEDDDRITVTYDDEFQVALRSNPPAKFQLFSKTNLTIIVEENKLIKARIVYGGGLYGNVGDYNEVVFKSYDLTLNKLNGAIWGTNIYTGDSNLLKALIHSCPNLKLTKNPPTYDIIATFKLLPGKSSYFGSHSNGIESNSYGDWDSSFSIENIRYEPINGSDSKVEKNKDLESE